MGQSTQSPGERNLGSPAPASSCSSSSTSLPRTATTAGHKTHEAKQDFTWPFMLKLYICNKSIYVRQRSPGWCWERHCEPQSKARSAHPQHFISFSIATLPMHVTAAHQNQSIPATAGSGQRLGEHGEGDPNQPLPPVRRGDHDQHQDRH